MYTLKRIIITFLFFILTQNLFAHALWIETKANGIAGQAHEIKVFYGEYLTNEKEEPTKWYSDVNQFSLWLSSPGKEKVKLEVKPEADCYKAQFIPEGNTHYILTIVHQAKELGEETKYEFSSYAIVSIGKVDKIKPESIENSLKLLINQAKQFKVNQPLKLQAFLNNAPVANQKVSVFSPTGWTKTYVTDENGNIEFSPSWSGRYVLEVSDFKKIEGSHYDKKYKAVWKGATSSFEIVK